ncbi:hypothetical protein LXL04_031691 [Taraxacum kok-saghyz]
MPSVTEEARREKFIRQMFVFSALMATIRTVRNDRIFNKVCGSVTKVVDDVFSVVYDWMRFITGQTFKSRTKNIGSFEDDYLDHNWVKYGAPWTTWMDHGSMWGIGGQKESDEVGQVGGERANHHLAHLLPDPATQISLPVPGSQRGYYTIKKRSVKVIKMQMYLKSDAFSPEEDEASRKTDESER